MTIVSTPRLPNTGKGIGEVVKVVINVVKKIWDMVTKKPAEDGSKLDSVNDNSSLENIDKITEIFSGFKSQVHQRSVEIENAMKEEVDFYIDELRELLLEYQETTDKYEIRMSRIERKIDRILPRLDGIIDHEISKKVSLDDMECRQLMKMIPGEKKEKALQEFLETVIKNALEVCCSTLNENLEEIFSEVEEEIIGKVEYLQNNSAVQFSKLEELRADNQQEKVRQMLAEANYIVDVCGLVEEVL